MSRSSLVFALWLGMLSGCKNAATRQGKNPVAGEAQAAGLVLSSPEVAAVAAEISKLSGGSVKAILISGGEVERQGGHYFVVQFAEDHPDHVATIGWFYVNKSTGEILHEDTASCTFQTLAQWHESRHGSP